jgi:hypothetical protein
MKWEDSDIVQLREYQKKSAGRLLQYLKSRIPRCDGATIEQVALQAKFKEGFESVIKEIEEMMSDPNEIIDPSSGRFAEM